MKKINLFQLADIFEYKATEPYERDVSQKCAYLTGFRAASGSWAMTEPIAVFI